MRSISILSLVGLSLALLGGHAVAQPSHGSLCNPQTASVSSVLYNQWGANNVSNTMPATVFCGGGKASSMAGILTATVHDRSSVEDVCCSFRVTNAAGSLLSTARRCTTGFASTPMTLVAGVPPISGYVSIECTIPKYQVATGPSAITTYDVR